MHKGGESTINYTKIQNDKALVISVVNSYTEYQLMHTFIEIFQKGVKNSAQIGTYQEELRREEKFINRK